MFQEGNTQYRAQKCRHVRVRLGLFLLCLDDGLNDQTLDVVIEVLEGPRRQAGQQHQLGVEAGVEASTFVYLHLGFLT